MPELCIEYLARRKTEQNSKPSGQVHCARQSRLSVTYRGGVSDLCSQMEIPSCVLF